jgi:polysaccharide biosynthesis protein PslG
MKLRPATIAASLAVAACLLLSACGSSSDDGGGDPAIGGRYGAFFGVAPSETPNDADLARMAAGGIGSYHLLLSWQTIEQTKGTYNWTAYDAEFHQLATHGIEPIPYVIGTPPGYAPVSTDPPTSSGEAFDAWADFLKAAAARYGPDGDYWQTLASSDPDLTPQPIHIWEIWNEPNSSVFWTPAPDPGAYAALLKRSSRVIKGVDPEAEVMTAGMFLTPQSDGAIESTDFLRQVYDHHGIADAVDAVAVHPYGPTVGDVMNQVTKTHDVIEEVGDDASMWVTEIGWGSDPSSGNELAKTPDKQAELLTKSFTKLLDQRDALGLQGVIWYTWHDGDLGGDCVWCATAGLVDADRDSKPAWLAFTDLTGGTP